MVLEIEFFNGKAPGDGIKYIVRKHLDKLVQNIIKDVQLFSLKTNLKERTLCQLYNLIVCAEDKIKPFCNDILK
jgi:hypothetical protein